MHDNPRRYWLWRDRLLTSAELQAANLSLVRCVDLGRARSLTEAKRRAQAWLADHGGAFDDAAVAAANARLIGDRADRATCARYGVTIAEADAIMRDSGLVIKDAAGTLQIGWRHLPPESESEP